MTNLSSINIKRKKTNTIFVVDQDQDNLVRFRKLFHQYRNLVYYSTSPDDLTSVMEGVSPDLVICNLFLEEYTAEDFFKYIKKKAPHAVRVVYSRESNKLELMRLLACGVVHRFFCLPWEKNKIDELLARDLETRSKLRTKKVCDFLEQEDSIPILPDIVCQMGKILQDPNHSIAQLVAVIERDPLIASKLLQIVNSSAFPKNATIGNLQHAVTYLGIKQVREVILFICAREIFPPSKRCLEVSTQVAEQSFRCSKLASLIAKTLCPGLEKETATAALLHDIGKMVFYSPPYCKTYISAMSDEKGNYNPTGPGSEFDDEVYGIAHTELGSCLLLWWDMPLSIVETAASHSLPLENLSGISKSVGIACRCLLEVDNPGENKSELDSLRGDWPVDQWLDEAKNIICS